jgi:predicted Rossmann fold flavoprotein
MCAGSLSKKKDVLVVDGNSKVAKKLKISGGGKCNITNVTVSADNFDGNTELIQHVLKKFSQKSLLKFLERNRVALEIRKSRYYFCKESSDDIIGVLKHSAKNAEFLLDATIIGVSKKGDIFRVTTSKGEYLGRNIVVATGGKSFSSLGASDIGIEVAKEFNIQSKSFAPALVGLTLQKEQFWMKELSGLSCYVRVDVADKSLHEEMLFAHKGISGPAILSASLYWQKGLISIDFLPDKNIIELTQGSKKLVSSVLNLPKRLSKALLLAVDVKDKECKKLSKEEKTRLAMLHNYSFAPAGNFGFTKAEVSRGGIMAQELNMDTLESKRVKGLYFIGEVVDVTGELGGYNFQWAFSSAYVCAKALN